MSANSLMQLREDSSGTIRVRSHPKCFLCETLGEPLYENLVDHLFGAPGTWNLKRCPNSKCGLVWLDPIPVEEDIAKAYAKYYTHGEVAPQRTPIRTVLARAGTILRSLANPFHGERDSLFLMYLDKTSAGRLLDVGCGDGFRLSRLRALGWDVYGQDVDPVAVGYAHEKMGLQAYCGYLRDLPLAEGSFDCVILNHVIEHAHDPVGLLKDSHRFLKTGGLLMIVTPNVNSFGREHFGPYWRGLEPPRHIHLFSPKTLSATAVQAGFTINRVWTSVANAQGLAHGSLAIKNGGSPSTLKSLVLNEVYSLAYLYRSTFEHLRDANSGEECVLRATR